MFTPWTEDICLTCELSKLQKSESLKAVRSSLKALAPKTELTVVHQKMTWLLPKSVKRSLNKAKTEQLVKNIPTCLCPKQVKNTTHAVPHFRLVDVSQSVRDP